MIPRRLFFVSTFFVVLASILAAQKLHPETQIKTEGSVTTATFKTSAGEVRVYLPGDMIAGDTLSGTVLAEPSGNIEKEKQKNVSILNGLVIQFGSQRWPVAGGVVQKMMIAPPPTQKPQLILLDEKGKRVGTATLPLLPLESGTLLLLPPPKTDTTQNFEFPPLGQSGHPLRIAGPFDGDSANTDVQIGSSPPKIIAESPRGVVVRIPSGTTGQNNISASDNGHSATGRFRALKIELTAPKTSLLKGESTELHVSVNGLEGLSQPTQIQLQNQTPSNINLSGGNTQNIIIQPSQVTTGGTFNWTTNVTGISPGGFNITGTIPSGATTSPSPTPVTTSPTATPPPPIY